MSIRSAQTQGESSLSLWADTPVEKAIEAYYEGTVPGGSRDANFYALIAQTAQAQGINPFDSANIHSLKGIITSLIKPAEPGETDAQKSAIAIELLASFQLALDRLASNKDSN